MLTGKTLLLTYFEQCQNQLKTKICDFQEDESKAVTISQRNWLELKTADMKVFFLWFIAEWKKMTVHKIHVQLFVVACSVVTLLVQETSSKKQKNKFLSEKAKTNSDQKFYKIKECRIFYKKNGSKTQSASRVALWRYANTLNGKTQESLYYHAPQGWVHKLHSGYNFFFFLITWLFVIHQAAKIKDLIYQYSANQKSLNKLA